MSGGDCRGHIDRYIDLLGAHPGGCGDRQAGDLDCGFSVKELAMEGDHLTVGTSADRSGICRADFGPVTDGQATLAKVGVPAADHGDVAETGGSRSRHRDRRRELGSADAEYARSC